jgi:hypothetical protein
MKIFLFASTILITCYTCNAQNQSEHNFFIKNSHKKEITYIMKSDDSYTKISSKDFNADSISMIDLISPYLISMDVYKGSDAVKKFDNISTEIVIVYFLKNSFAEKLPSSIKSKFYRKI